MRISIHIIIVLVVAILASHSFVSHCCNSTTSVHVVSESDPIVVAFDLLTYIVTLYLTFNIMTSAQVASYMVSGALLRNWNYYLYN